MKEGDKSGQVWVETIIYTLIAFVMIGMVLAFASPKVQEIQDKTIIEQSVRVMEDLHIIITDSIGIPGNKRLVELTIKKGELIIDGVNDLLIFQMDTKLVYSQPGENISYGSIIANTEEKGELKTVKLTGNYSNYNLTYDGNDEVKTLSKASTPYKIFITNKGDSVIDFKIG